MIEHLSGPSHPIPPYRHPSRHSHNQSLVFIYPGIPHLSFGRRETKRRGKTILAIHYILYTITQSHRHILEGLFPFTLRCQPPPPRKETVKRTTTRATERKVFCFVLLPNSKGSLVDLGYKYSLPITHSVIVLDIGIHLFFFGGKKVRKGKRENYNVP